MPEAAENLETPNEGTPQTGQTTEPEETPSGEQKAEQTPKEETPKEETPKEDAPKDWREGITDSEAKKIAERYQSLDELAKAQLELRQKLSKAVFVPGEKATDEEKAAFNKALGVPEDINDYALDLPKDFDQEVLTTDEAKQSLESFAKIAQAAGVSKDAFKAITGEYFRQIDAAQKATIDADKQFAKETEEALKEEWGKGFNKEKEYANRGAEWVFGDDFNDFTNLKTSDDRLVGDHPLLLKALNKIGRAISEDVVPAISASPEDVDTLREQLDKLTAEQDTASKRGEDAKVKALDKKIMEISTKISGDNPIG